MIPLVFVAMRDAMQAIRGSILSSAGSILIAIRSTIAEQSIEPVLDGSRFRLTSFPKPQHAQSSQA